MKRLSDALDAAFVHINNASSAELSELFIRYKEEILEEFERMPSGILSTAGNKVTKKVIG